MTNHPNRGWRKRWVVNTAQRTATHQSGLTVQFDAQPDEEGGINGRVISSLPTLSADRAQAQRQANTLARLLREAGEIYQERKNDRR